MSGKIACTVIPYDSLLNYKLWMILFNLVYLN